MAVLNFAGKTGSSIGTNWANFQPIYTDNIPGVNAREAADGSRPWLITNMVLYVSGNGGSRTITPFVANAGGSSSNNLPVKTVASSSSAQANSFPASVLRTSTGNLRVGFNNGLSGATYFGRNASTGHTITVTGGTSISNYALAGNITYAQAPSAPRTLTVSAVGNVATLNWLAPSSNGDSAITGYRIEYSDDNGANWTPATVGNVLTHTLTLTAGLTYDFRISALNAVTTAKSTWSVYSNTVTETMADVRELYVDAILITQDVNSAIPFFDGNSPDGVWDSTTNNSKSRIPNAGLEPLYDAQADDNNIFSVDASAVQIYDLTSRGIYAQTIYNPEPVDTVGPVIAGQYTITASDKLPVIASQWIEYGGAVMATANDAGGLVITIQGPTEIPGVPAPFTLTRSDGATEYANLKIAGTGIVVKPETVTVFTGANPNQIVNEIAGTISSPYITTIEDAYNVAVANSSLVNSTQPTLTLTVNLADIPAYGWLVGGVILWREMLWRMTGISYNNLSATGTFIPHTTIDDFNEVWEAYTIDYFNSVWEGYKIKDVNRRPLYAGQ